MLFSDANYSGNPVGKPGLSMGTVSYYGVLLILTNNVLDMLDSSLEMFPL